MWCAPHTIQYQHSDWRKDDDDDDDAAAADDDGVHHYMDARCTVQVEIESAKVGHKKETLEPTASATESHPWCVLSGNNQSTREREETSAGLRLR